MANDSTFNFVLRLKAENQTMEAKQISFEVKLLTKLKKYLPADSSDGKAMISMEEGSTLHDLKGILGIPADEFDGIVIDRVHSEIEDSDVLNNGESFTFYATVGGG